MSTTDGHDKMDRTIVMGNLEDQDNTSCPNPAKVNGS